MRLLKLPRFGRQGPGKSTLGMPEQLALKQRFGESRTINRDERTIATRAQIMDHPSQQLFAGTAFRLNQDIGIASCCLPRPRQRAQESR